MIKALATVVFVSLSHLVTAQDDDTVRYMHGLPVTGEDTVAQEDTVDQLPRDVLIPVRAEEIPRLLRKALKNEQFNGWERAGVHLQRNTGLYVVRIATEGTVRTYLFSRRGKVVSFRERANRQR